jgi:hypothetical protein
MTANVDLNAALTARYAGRFAEAAGLLRPLAEAGNRVAQVHLAEIVVYGWHAWAGSVHPRGPQRSVATSRRARDRGTA